MGSPLYFQFIMHVYLSNTDAPKCPEEKLDGVSWAVTAGGGTDVEPCPNGASGK